MIEEYKKDYIKGKRFVKRILLILIVISVIFIGIKLLKDIGGVVVFPVKRVVVYGNKYVSSKDIIKLLGLGPTTSILSINRNKAADTLKSDPRIEAVVVVKVYPDTVKIYLKEKSRFIPLLIKNELYAISSDGVVLGRIKNKLVSDTPVLQILNYDDIKTGNKLDNFLILETLKAINRLKEKDNNFFSTIDRISIGKSGVFINIKNDKYSVYLGDNINSDVFNKLKVLIGVLESSREADGGKQISINMSFSHAAVKIRE